MVAYKRIWISNHYKSLGLSLDDCMRIGKQYCYYCGSAPSLVNPWGHNPDTAHCLRSNNSRAQYWIDSWVYWNGIDKVVPALDYADLTNLVPCCYDCNFMKHKRSKENFLIHTAKITDFQRERNGYSENISAGEKKIV